MNKRYKYLIVFSIIILIANSLLYFEKEQKIKEHLAFEVNKVKLNFNAIYEEHKELAQVIFETNIDQKNVKDIFKKAYTATEAEKNILREKLYQKLKPTYSKLIRHNLKQLHFHLPNNDSFLRFHRPNRFGDNLTKIRSTVDYVNKNKKPIDGFEEGRIYNGFRFVYPLFDETNTHIGSVEVSFSTLSFSEIFYHQFETVTSFLIMKKVANEKLFEEEKKNYEGALFKDFYIEKDSLRYLKTHIKNFDKEYNLNIKERSLLNTQALQGGSDSLNIKSREFIFIPLKNPVTKNIEALFFIQHNHSYIDNKHNNYYFITVLVNVFLVLIGYLLYRNDREKTKLKNTNKKLETILKEADSGIALMDLDGNFLDVNVAYSKILGYSKEELLELSCIELTAIDQRENAIEILKKAKNLGSISKQHKVCIKKDKNPINLEFSLTLLPKKDSFIAVINSIEEKLSLEKLNKTLQLEVDKQVNEIRQKDKMLFQQSKTAAMGEMIDAVAHQWKSPLGIIKLYVNQIEYSLEIDEEIPKEDLVEFSKKMDHQIDHLVNTIDEFRSFFRQKNNYEDIPIQALLDSVKKLMKDELIKNMITVETQGDTTQVVKVIPNEFKHVLINMLSNSKDAFIEKNIDNRKIYLEVLDDKDTISLKVKDNAGGIPDELLDKIFDPNFTTKQEDKGTGIGLYMSKQILDKMGANVIVSNENNGVCFEIQFR